MEFLLKMVRHAAMKDAHLMDVVVSGILSTIKREVTRQDLVRGREHRTWWGSMVLFTSGRPSDTPTLTHPNKVARRHPFP